MKKTTKHYLKAIVSLTLGGFGLFQTISGWITGSIYFPSKYSSSLVSLTENSTGFYMALVLWVAVTAGLLVFGVQNLRKANQD